MKKKLEAELISIAHRILKLKNKSDLNQLHQETQKLYEKLSILKFVEENFAEVKPTIGQAAIEDKIEAAFEPQEETGTRPEVADTTAAIEEIPVTETQIQSEDEPAVREENVAEDSETETEENQAIATETEDETPEDIETEEIISATEEMPEEAEEPVQAVSEETTEEPVKPQDSGFKPAFELSFETKDEEIAEQIKEEIKKSPQITFDDLLGANYADPVFVKPEDLERESRESKNVIPIGRSYNDSAPVISLNKDQEDKTISINDRLSKGIIIGLNDRIAFMNHLFANSSEDYNRVLSQLMTFDTFADAKNFIDTMVKPDYDNWDGKDEYAERFMEIVEKKFS